MNERDKHYGDFLSPSLINPKEVAAYLNAVMGLGDKDALLVALRQVAKAHGMDSLLEDGTPMLDSANKIMCSVGLRLSVPQMTLKK